MDNVAPNPQNNPVATSEKTAVKTNEEMSKINITIAGCGGCGINLARNFVGKSNVNVLFFDTSMANSKLGESAYIFGDESGSGSGSNRAANARQIESATPQLSSEEIGENDIAIVMFSLAGGTGSVVAPMLIREYHRRGMRVIALAVSATDSAVSAKNTLNTLKTLTAITKNNDLYLPLMLLSNDEGTSRGAVDHAAVLTVNDLLELLLKNVYEIDRNDRLNWINPTKIVNSQPGIKLLSLISDKKVPDERVIVGGDSKEMVDSLLILQQDTNQIVSDLPLARLKKTGFYVDQHRTIVGSITSDIKPVDKIIDYVERTEAQTKAQRHMQNDRLSHDSGDDLIL